MAEPRALVPADQPERDVGEERRAHHADPRVGGRHPAFGGRDVGPPLQQRGGNAGRDRGQIRDAQVRRERERRGRHAAERRDRVLVQRAPSPHVLGRRAGRVELRLRARDVEIGCDAARVPAHREFQRTPVRVDRVGQQLLLLVEPAQVEVRVREAGLQAQLHRCEIVGAGLRVRAPGRDLVAHLAPQVEVVVEAGLERVRAVHVRLVRAAQRARGRLPVARDLRAEADGREQPCARLIEQRAGFVVAGHRGGHVGVGGCHPRFEPVEHRIAERLPPAVAGDAVGRLCRLPAARFLETGRQRGGRRVIDGRERAGGEERDAGEHRAEPTRVSHSHAPCRARPPRRCRPASRAGRDRPRTASRAGCRSRDRRARGRSRSARACRGRSRS
ncbi:Uncharacterised protein [Burkholderia cepacia]|uniref:Uncharacterized protein n=1 Tax=Burkholderia cepacia TaxID=292 RepID=A0AAE8NIC4_BURCE|nr:Uncharacterised protein [Burkholderia cepacia]